MRNPVRFYVKENMDDLQDLQPGRIKRKNKKNPSERMMQLPGTDTPSASAAILSNDILPSSLLDASSPQSRNSYLLDDLLKQEEPTEAAPETLLENETPPTPAAPTASATPSTSWLRGVQGEGKGPADDIADILQSSIEKRAASQQDMTPAEHTPKTVSPLDLLDAAREETKTATGREDIRKLTPSQRKKHTKHQAPEPPTTDAVETTIQRATQAADKTLEAMNQLQAVIDKAERRHFFNSAAAYVLFCVILTLGLYYALNYRASAKYAYQLVQQERYEKLLNAKKILDAEFERDQRASSEAYEVYQLVEQERYEEAIERYIKIQANLTHPAEAALLAQKIDTIRWRMADNAYHDGIILFREQNYDQARDAFFKSLTYKENTAYTHMLHYYLATCLFQLGDFEGARSNFEKAQENGLLNAEMDANARYYRAVSAEKVGDLSEAYTQYELFTRKYRYHKNADDANRAKARLEKTRPKD